MFSYSKKVSPGNNNNFDRDYCDMCKTGNCCKKPSLCHCSRCMLSDTVSSCKCNGYCNCGNKK